MLTLTYSLGDGDSVVEAAQFVHQTPIERLSARPDSAFRYLENLLRTAKRAKVRRKLTALLQ